jgi:hypothetical protein
MNTSMVQSKFLSNPEDIGVVAVGFSGGQVRGAAARRQANTAAELVLPKLPSPMPAAWTRHVHGPQECT